MAILEPAAAAPHLHGPLAGHQFSAARIATIYLLAGLLWIGLSDATLAFSGGLTPSGLWVAVSKGMLFVLLSAGLVYWLCRREYREIKRATDLLRAVVEGTTDAVFVKDRAGRYLLVNSAAAQYMGRQVEEVLGHDDCQLLSERDGQLLMANDRTIMASQEVVTLEETLTVAGVTRTYSATKAPYFDGAGAVTGLIGISRDITSREQVERALRKTDARLREAQRIARLGSWSWEPSTNHVWWSDAEFELFGVSRHNVQPSFESFVALLHPDDRPIAIARVQAMNVGGYEFADDLRVVRADGSIIWIHSQARATRDSSGKLLRVEGTDQDITAQRAAEARLREKEMLVREAAELAQVGGWGFDPVTLKADWTPAVAKMFGLPHDAPPTVDKAVEYFGIEHRPMLQHALDAAARDGLPHDLELKLVGADGVVRWVRTICRPIVENGRVLRVRGSLQDITDRKRVESDGERSAAMLRSVLDSVGDAIVTIDARGNVTTGNRATELMFGYSITDLIGQNAWALLSESHRQQNDRLLPNLSDSSIPLAIGVGREVECIRKNGTTFPAELRITEFVREGEQEFTVVLRDITARRQLEEQFRQAQKMEAIGRLAGGVAHDFNNLLTVINGYSELVLADLPVNDPARGPLAAIHDAGDRAARLTGQLLAFSRKSMIEPRLVDLNELVVESARLFRRLIGEDIALSVLTQPSPLLVVLDPGQLEQVLMNLAVNARDAMPTGGRLTIETRTEELLNIADRLPAEPAAGHYALLRVTDTGFGMSSDVCDKIFEPFFTTKGVGKGTGLGLAVVHGIVQQSGGFISVESAPGAGTSFHILLPAVNDITHEAALREASVAPRGVETILVVEDEEAVRTLIRAALEGQGYTVLTASGAGEAHALLHAHVDPIDLLVTDVIMPEISGHELAVALRATHPMLPVLYISGYTDDALDRHGLQGTAAHFIQKPFTPLGLARRVREILDQ